MDTMTITKTLGAICGALLVFLLGNFVAGGLYTVGEEVAHDEEHVQGYAIEVAEASSGEAASDEPQVPFAEVYAVADAAEGESLWRQCASCHKLDGSNATGPYLNGVVDRPKHAVEGYTYSEGMLASEGAWSPESISAFILAPKEYVPGTKMAYRGMDDAADRANLIAYLAAQPG